jgi:hypothetical protein
MPNCRTPPPRLGNLGAFDRQRLVGAREQLLSKLGPVLAQIPGQLLHRHPVQAGTALVLPHPLQRGPKVGGLHDPLHQPARSRASGLARRRRLFLAPLRSRGFTPAPQRELQLPGHLRLFAFEAHERLALLSVQPFAAPGSYYGLC